MDYSHPMAPERNPDNQPLVEFTVPVDLNFLIYARDAVDHKSGSLADELALQAGGGVADSLWASAWRLAMLDRGGQTNGDVEAMAVAERLGENGPSLWTAFHAMWEGVAGFGSRSDRRQCQDLSLGLAGRASWTLASATPQPAAVRLIFEIILSENSFILQAEKGRLVVSTAAAEPSGSIEMLVQQELRRYHADGLG